MRNETIEGELGAANPVGKSILTGLDLAAGEAALGEALLAEFAQVELEVAAVKSRHHPRRPRRALLALAGLTAGAAATAAVLLLGAGGTGSPAPAYGAELVRFAESTPLLLLEGPGWRVAYVNEDRRGPGMPPEGQMEFVTGSQATLAAHLTRAQAKHHVLPPAVLKNRQSRVELTWKDSRRSKLVWRNGKLGFSAYDPYYKKRVTFYEPGQAFKTTVAGLGTVAYVDPHAENPRLKGESGNRSMVAFWTEGGNLLELRASVPDLPAFEERLGWLTKVDSQTWLGAMPASVVKAADHKTAVREMLKGIPGPDSFKPSRVPDTDLTTDRYQLGAAVTGTVSCLWLRQWGEGRRTGDEAAVSEAVRAMRTSKRWLILHEMAKEGAYPQVIWEISKWMPNGYFEWAGHKRRLLAQAESLGCARDGLPLLPWKQRRQRERANSATAAQTEAGKS
jgi:hypothetical protein